MPEYKTRYFLLMKSVPTDHTCSIVCSRDIPQAVVGMRALRQPCQPSLVLTMFYHDENTPLLTILGSNNLASPLY